ncbi:protein MAK11, partial [Trypanosoma theileri]
MSSKTKSKSNIPAKQPVQDHTDAKPPQPAKEITTTTNTNTTNIISTNSMNSSSTVKSISTAAAAGRRTLGCCGALLVIGTYHSVMAGLVFRRDRLALLFSIKHHDGCINTIAVGDKYIASAGTDERVFLFTNKNHQSHLT